MEQMQLITKSVRVPVVCMCARFFFVISFNFAVEFYEKSDSNDSQCLTSFFFSALSTTNKFIERNNCQKDGKIALSLHTMNVERWLPEAIT